MTELEDRLRRDLTALADCVQPENVRPLREPSPRRRASVIRWLAPLTAAVAVITIIVASVVLASRPVSRRPAPGAPAVMPSYYVTVNGVIHYVQVHGSARAAGVAVTATVRDSKTGAVLSTVQVPCLVYVPSAALDPIASHCRPVVQASGGDAAPGIEVPAPPLITAANNDRVFAISDNAGVFILTIGADGRSARLHQVQSLAGVVFSGPPALSPDGRQLAIDLTATGGGSVRDELEIVTLTTGARRTWSGPNLGGLLDPQWVDNGQQVMVRWQTGHRGPPTGYRLLNLADNGSSLLRDSTPIASPIGLFSGLYAPALLTPAGNALITSDFQNSGSYKSGTARLRLIEISATTGRVLRVLHVADVPYVSAPYSNQVSADQDCNALSLAPAGLYALVQCADFGRLDGDRFTPLPGIPAANWAFAHTATDFGDDAAW